MFFSVDMEMVVRLLLASLLGGIIGLEREVHGRPAGFRTHLLVSLGSSLFVVTSIEFYKIFGNFTGNGPVGVDPGRVAAQVVTGIGFLGAGAIIKEKASIRGLTTAACLWVASAVGLACGAGIYGPAIMVTGLALISLLYQMQLKLLGDLFQDPLGALAPLQGIGNSAVGSDADVQWTVKEELQFIHHYDVSGVRNSDGQPTALLLVWYKLVAVHKFIRYSLEKLRFYNKVKEVYKFDTMLVGQAFGYLFLGYHTLLKQHLADPFVRFASPFDCVVNLGECRIVL